MPIPPAMNRASTSCRTALFCAVGGNSTVRRKQRGQACAPTPPCSRDRLSTVAKLRLFASAREAAGTGSDAFDGATVADVLNAATERYGSGFADVLGTCRIWVNGNDVASDTMVGPNDEVAVLPPVSGGST